MNWQGLKKGAAVAAVMGGMTTSLWAQTVSPAANAQVTDHQPTITVNFTTAMRSAKITVDGRDFTPNAKLQGQLLTLKIPYALDNGIHRVVAEGTNLFGLKENTNWQFNIVNAGAQPAAASGKILNYYPGANTVVLNNRPELTASFPEPVKNVKWSVDQVDYSAQVVTNDKQIKVLPTSNLVNGKHLVSLSAVGAQTNTVYNQSWNFETKPGTAIAAQNMNPPANTVVKNARPFIAADFPQPALRSTMTVDGKDVSSLLSRTDTKVSWSPAYDLSDGVHKVTVEGQAANGQVMSSTWSFTTQTKVQNTNNNNSGGGQLHVDDPQPNDQVGDVFQVMGQATAGANVKVFVRADKGNGRVYTFKGVADEAGFFQIPVSARWAPKKGRLSVQVQALDANTGQNVAPPQNFKVTRQ